jgi:hypothetical protein
MAYAVLPAISLGRAPLVTDDVSRGYVIGSTAVDPQTNPPTLYVCADNTLGAACWVAAGGVSVEENRAPLGVAHTLNFAAGKVEADANGVITFTPPSGWARRDTFIATAGQTFFPVSSLSTEPGRSMVTRNGLVVAEGANNDYSVSPTGVTFVYGLEVDTVVQVFS